VGRRHGSGAWRPSRPPGAGVLSLGLSPDGKLLATGSPRPHCDDLACRRRRPRPLGSARHPQGHRDGVSAWRSRATACALHRRPPERSAHQDWDTVTWKEQASLVAICTRSPRLAFTPSGRRLVSSSDDKMLILWDLAAAKQQPSSRVTPNAVTSLAVAPTAERWRAWQCGTAWSSLWICRSGTGTRHTRIPPSRIPPFRILLFVAIES